MEEVKRPSDMVDIHYTRQKEPLGLGHGIWCARKFIGNPFQVKRFVEKPALGTAPSNLAIIGRFILTAEIFQIIDKQESKAGGEIQLTDAIEKLNEVQNVYAYQFKRKTLLCWKKTWIYNNNFRVCAAEQ